MHIERFFVAGLAHVSYVVASGFEAVVVDPERNVEGYLAYLAKNELELRYIFLTHPHADFVATTLDVRPGALFGEGHAVDSLNIGISSPSFSVWSGFFLNPDLPVALVVEDETEAKRAQLELARIGFD
jgi:glyoxylase-like metal-dependent hydrolase (beta-lactamase superfamily II)